MPVPRGVVVGRAQRLVRTLAIILLMVVASAHIGSPDTWFRGPAGPYDVAAVIRLPGVIPGLAQIDITVRGDGVREVTAQPVIFDAGPEGAPPPDVATPIPGRPGSYHAELWFMRPGSFSVTIGVRGALGDGTVIVPVAAVPERQIALYPWLGWLLAALGTFLFAGAVTIFRAAGTDGITAPGAEPGAQRVRTGRLYAVVGAGILALGLYGARGWWRSVERAYVDELYRPYAAEARVDTAGGIRTLHFSITDSIWRSRRPRNGWERYSVSPLVPDHGKLMHLFLIQRDVPLAFAHVHPVATDSSTFVVSLGALPAGRYRAVADVVHESGFPQTMVAEVDVPQARGPSPVTDPDDAVFVGAPTGARYQLPGGASITWEGMPDTLRVGEEAGLHFTLREADGSTSRLTPYLGMAGHAVVYRTDGQVYIHLHPNGTISMVAQAALGARERTDTVQGMLARRLAEREAAQHQMVATFDGTLIFPYAFPQPGQYRVWVQVQARRNHHHGTVRRRGAVTYVHYADAGVASIRGRTARIGAGSGSAPVVAIRETMPRPRARITPATLISCVRMSAHSAVIARNGPMRVDRQAGIIAASVPETTTPATLNSSTRESSGASSKRVARMTSPSSTIAATPMTEPTTSTRIALSRTSRMTCDGREPSA